VAEAFGVEIPPPVQVLKGSNADFTECRELSDLTGGKDGGPAHPDSEYPILKKGQKKVLGAVSQHTDPTSPRESSREEVVEKGKYRLEAVQSGKQPSYGGRTQLIPDGLQDPLKHLELAKTNSPAPMFMKFSLLAPHMGVVSSPDLGRCIFPFPALTATKPS